jgi:hypothetical protein
MCHVTGVLAGTLATYPMLCRSATVDHGPAAGGLGMVTTTPLRQRITPNADRRVIPRYPMAAPLDPGT